ncbi:MAG: barstar family protein [Eubacteriales bacterium]|nr:barstar family protein [Eubacteriales bacterium]
MGDREQAHTHLAKRLRLVPHYGRNLDALADCLGEIGEPTTILVRNADQIARRLGAYGERLLTVLHDAAQKNGNIDLVIPKDVRNKR